MAKKLKNYYRVLRGTHAEGGKTYGKGRPDGEIVNSKSDLSVMNGVGVSPKFEHLPDYIPQKERPAARAAEAAGESGEAHTEITDPLDVDLESLSKVKLVEFAADNEIPVDVAGSKQDILTSIQEALTV